MNTIKRKAERSEIEVLLFLCAILTVVFTSSVVMLGVMYTDLDSNTKLINHLESNSIKFDNK